MLTAYFNWTQTQTQISNIPFQISVVAGVLTTSFPIPGTKERHKWNWWKKIKIRRGDKKSALRHLTFTLLFLASWIASSLNPSTCVAGSAKSKMRSRYTKTGSWPSLLQGTWWVIEVTLIRISKQNQSSIIRYHITELLVNEKWVLETLSLTDPRNPALTFTGNLRSLSASGLSCIFVSSTSPAAKCYVDKWYMKLEARLL